MTEQDLEHIETSLGVKLPDEYRRTMTSDDCQRNGEFWYGGLFNQPGRIIEDTQRLRDITSSFDAPCPLTWVVVGEINGGDPTFVDTAEAGSPLRYWNHETMQVENCTTTVTAFVKSALDLI
ncbi:MAG: hypothetical protein JWN24_3779 [Phycisphaerales bacterium]|nr:hypothetical protein [Phycisphaerales bacterium]